MRRATTLIAALAAAAWAGPLLAGSPNDDTIVLSVGGTSKLQLTLTWTGGRPNFQILRGTDPAGAGGVINLRGVTGDSTWTEDPIRPLPGSGLYYLVQETQLVPGTFPLAWIDGTDCGSEPMIQVHAYNADTYILRQSLCTSFEGNFLYLLFGEDKVLLQDTGNGGIPIADAVYGIIEQWLFDHGRLSIPLVVSHSHGHHDHVAGDPQFQGQPDTTVVAWTPAAVADHFGITGWPEQIVSYDLGGRIVDVIPSPGHQPAHIALYDRQTSLLLTGDTLYAGRLYIINSFSDFLESTQRMVDFIADKPVLWVVGNHIEMKDTPFDQFPYGATMHPDEHPLQLRREHLTELLLGLQGMADAPHYEVHAEFVIVPLL
jgi:glyoxylase-like metal-dependent hydrolase (beta-lactamase superfamily II)